MNDSEVCTTTSNEETSASGNDAATEPAKVKKTRIRRTNAEIAAGVTREQAAAIRRGEVSAADVIALNDAAGDIVLDRMVEVFGPEDAARIEAAANAEFAHSSDLVGDGEASCSDACQDIRGSFCSLTDSQRSMCAAAVASDGGETP